MARWGNVDYKQLVALQKKMQQLEKADARDICIDVSYALAQRLLSKVKKRTPTGVYDKPVEFTAKIPKKEVHFFTRDGKEVSFTAKARSKHVKFVPKTGMVGGTLRRNWDVSKLIFSGNTYTIEVFNDTEYAMYVEYGHRTVNHNGWVKGRFMLTISEKEVQELAPRLIQNKIEAKLREVFE